MDEDHEVDQSGMEALLDRGEKKSSASHVSVAIGMPHCDGAVVVVVAVAERQVREACVAGACRIHAMLRRMAS